MKNKINWLLSLFLVAFISVFNVSQAHAETNPFAETNSSLSIELGKIHKALYGIDYKPNVILFIYEQPNQGFYLCSNKYTGTGMVVTVFESDTPISLSYTSGATGVTLNSTMFYNTQSIAPIDNCSECQSRNTKFVSLGLAKIAGSYSSNYNNSFSAGRYIELDGAWLKTPVKILSRGDVSINRSTYQSNFDEGAIIPPNDILNYNWTGNGMKIYNLSKGMNVSGYQDTSGLKYFDIEAYGKFIYTGDDTFFTTLKYKSMQTSIQLASILTYGTQTRRTGEGLGIKSFEWVSDTSHLNKGDEIKFRIVYQAPMLDKGTYNISVGTTINNGTTDQWIVDTVTGLNFLNENADTGNFNNTGETGNVGNTPGNIPQGSDMSVNGTLTSIMTMFSSFSGFIGSIFGFLPTEIKVMFTGVCILITGLMVKRAVL